jgi:hypothetical protein
MAKLSRYLELGSKGGKVIFVKFLFILARIGHRLGRMVTGDTFGEQLERRVKLFQMCQGFHPDDVDGKFGPETSKAFANWFLDGWNINDILTRCLCFKGEGAMNNLRMVVLRILSVDMEGKLEFDGRWGEVAQEKTCTLQALYGLKETGIWDEPLNQALSDEFGIDFADITPEIFTKETVVVGDPDTKED